MNKIIKRARNYVLALFGVVALVAGLSVGSGAAFAGVDGGNNGGSGGGGGYNPNFEVWAVYNDSGAWNAFSSRAIGDQYNGEAAVVNMLNSMNPGLAANCQKSRLIVWLQATGSRWGQGSGFLYRGGNNNYVARTIAGWGDTTYFWDGNMQNFGTSGQQQVGVFVQSGSVNAQARNDVKNWAYNGGSYHNGTVIVCAWNDPTSCPGCGETHTRMTDSSTATESWTLPYGYATSVQREITAPEGSNNKNPAGGDIDPSGDDPIGVDNLHNQPTVTMRTEFGSIYDSLANSTSEELPSLRARIEAARSTDLNADRPDVTLDANNQAGLREGGVLSVYENTTRATITASQTEAWEKCHNNVVRQDFNSTTRTWGPIYVASSGVAACSTRSDWTAKTSDAPAGTDAAWLRDNAWTRTGTNTLAVKTLTTPETTGFWQIVSVHCNPEDLAAALAEYGTEGVDYFVVSQTVTDKGVTQVIYTKKVSSRPTALGSKVFGVSNGKTNYASATALERTGMTGFFDKECATVCVADPSGGATSANGATSNVPLVTTDLYKSSKGGATLNTTVNSNYLQIFRNGEAHTLKVNTSYPQSTAVLSYDGSAPISTTVNLWNASTPDTTPYGGEFMMRTEAGEAVFNPFGAAPATQKNFGADPYKGPLSSTLAGLHRTFEVAGTWASTATRPVILNFKWEYQVKTPVTIPTILGFTYNGDRYVSGYATADQAIDVRCYATFGSASSSHLDLKAATHESTGTGTTNLLDARLIEGPSNEPGLPSDNSDSMSAHASENGDLAYNTSTNLVIKFIRAVSH